MPEWVETPEMAVPIRNFFFPSSSGDPSGLLLSGEVCERVWTIAALCPLAYRLISVYGLQWNLSSRDCCTGMIDRPNKHYLVLGSQINDICKSGDGCPSAVARLTLADA